MAARRPVLKATGERGSWFAFVAGERLPCIHQHWLKKLRYHDPHYEHATQWIELADAIRSGGKVVLTTGKIHADGYGFDRTGYVAVYRVANLAVLGGDLTFDLVERLADLK